MPIDWKQNEMTERLLAALIAAGDGKVDYKRVAHYFGQGATYDTIFNRFRNAIKQSKKLIDEAGDDVPASRNSKGSNAGTPRKSRAPATPGSGKRKRAAGEDKGSDEELGSKKKAKKGGKKSKMAEEIEEDEEDTVVEKEFSEEENEVKDEVGEDGDAEGDEEAEA